MLDPILPLAFALHNGKGTYAVLLGSGTSSAAGIPTGWQIVEDLLRRVAQMEGQNCEPDPAAWFRATHNEEVEYSTLLQMLAPSQTERRQLLRGYFEPSPPDREEGRKLPTPAHRRLAELVASGHVRVILTINFDRLIEQALLDLGISPAVIASPDQALGSIPLVHERITVVKIHGDYMDTRILNSPAELESYDKRMNRLLAQIIDEYGLLVCGWSAMWDPALRRSIERCPSRRFTTYWAARGELGDAAGELVRHRRAEVIRITNADDFFESLYQKVQALKDIDRPPLSARVAAASAKRYIEQGTYPIRLHDLVTKEAELVYQSLAQETDETMREEPTTARVKARMRRYESLAESSVAMAAVAGYWAARKDAGAWTRAVERTGSPSDIHQGYDLWRDLLRYPALLTTHAGALTAVAAENGESIRALLASPRLRTWRQRDIPAIRLLHADAVLERDSAKRVFGSTLRTSFQDHIHRTLRDPLRDYVPDNEAYDELFDRLEWIIALLY
jgi:hypothetical protein